MVNNTVRLLSEVERAAAFGRDSVGAVIRHVDNTALRRDLIRSRTEYGSVCDDAKNSLAKIGYRAGKNPQSVKMMMRTAVSAHLNRRRDTSAAAKMMIQGCTMGNIELLRAIHNNPAASPKAVSIASRAIKEQERTIESMKRYL